MFPYFGARNFRDTSESGRNFMGLDVFWGSESSFYSTTGVKKYHWSSEDKIHVICNVSQCLNNEGLWVWRSEASEGSTRSKSCDPMGRAVIRNGFCCPRHPSKCFRKFSLDYTPLPFWLRTWSQTSPRKSDSISDLEPFPRVKTLNEPLVASSKLKDVVRTSPYYTSRGESTSRSFYSFTTRCAWTSSDYWAGSGGISGTGSVSSCTHFNTLTCCFFSLLNLSCSR